MDGQYSKSSIGTVFNAANDIADSIVIEMVNF
jgi:hypothetical protein